MASFVPVSDKLGTEFSANLDTCNYMEKKEPVFGHSGSTVLHYPGSDPLEVTQSKEDIALMHAKLNK